MTTEALKLLIEECENANATGVAVIDLNAIAKAKEALAAPVAAEPARRMSPFDAVAEAMRLASLMGGSIGMSDVEKTQHYEQRLRSHLVEFIYAAPTPQPQPVREPLAISPLKEQQLFDDWCPYTGSPDPRVVWAAAVDAVNGVLLGITKEGA